MGITENLEKNLEKNKTNKNKTVTRLTTETGIVTANLHKVAEDCKYVHSISSLGLCSTVKGKGGTFNSSLQEL